MNSSSDLNRFSALDGISWLVKACMVMSWIVLKAPHKEAVGKLVKPPATKEAKAKPSAFLVLTLNFRIASRPVLGTSSCLGICSKSTLDLGSS